MLKLTGNRCQCATCGLPFNSVTAFDRHRIGSFEDATNPRRCLTAPELTAKGFTRNAGGWWITKRRTAPVAAA